MKKGIIILLFIFLISCCVSTDKAAEEAKQKYKLSPHIEMVDKSEPIAFSKILIKIPIGHQSGKD